MPEPAHKRQLISTVYATPLMTPTTDLGLSIRLSMFEFRETGDWNIFLGLPERARAETGGDDQRALKRRELSGFARVNKVTSASLGYPLSVFNKNSTLRHGHTKEDLLQDAVFASRRMCQGTVLREPSFQTFHCGTNNTCNKPINKSVLLLLKIPGRELREILKKKKIVCVRASASGCVSYLDGCMVHHSEMT